MIQYVVRNPNDLSNAVAALNCTKKMFDFVKLDDSFGVYQIIFHIYDLSDLIHNSELFDKFLQTKEARLLKLYGNIHFRGE